MSATTDKSRPAAAQQQSPDRHVGGVVIVSPGGCDGGGGMGSVTRVMAEWLKAQRPDLRVHVLDPRGDGPAWLWPFHFAAAAARLIAIGLGGKASILHLQVSERSSLIRKGLLLAVGRALGLRTILHHHGAEFIPFHRAAGRLMRRWVAWTGVAADLNIVLGERWRSFLVEEVGVDASKVVTLYNATADLGPARAARAACRWHFLLMANLSPRKGVDEFLAAVALLASQERDVTATIAGGGEVARYRAEAEALGIAARCRFTGWVGRTDVVKLIGDADALVLPSYDEGLPMVILEALSAGLPVIATPVGSIPEVLRHEETCLFVGVGDIAGVAAAMTRIATEPALAARLAAKGREAYEQRFEVGAFMVATLGLYHAVLDRRPDRGPKSSRRQLDQA